MKIKENLVWSRRKEIKKIVNLTELFVLYNGPLISKWLMALNSYTYRYSGLNSCKQIVNFIMFFCMYCNVEK